MTQDRVRLPVPDTKGGMTVERAIGARRSRRDFLDRPLTLGQVGQLLWSMQGCTGEGCLKAAPSAGATFPLEVFAVVGSGGVSGLEAGVYRYLPEDHELSLHGEGDVRDALAEAALGQPWVRFAPVVFVVAAEAARTTGRYGDRGVRYVHMEAGHAAQNLALQCESLGLGTVAVGAYRDASAASAVGLSRPLEVLYLLPVGSY